MIVWNLSNKHAPIQITISTASVVIRLNLSFMVRPRALVNFVNWSGMGG